MSEYVDFNALYPMKFKPIYQARIWGGTQMSEVLRREVPAAADPIGESWELVDREDEQSVLVNGPMAGRTMHELLKHYGRELVGRKAKSTDRFPLLVKLIDAGDRLSLQVHPDEAACREIGGTAEPKTEMWYIIAARKGAQILARHPTAAGQPARFAGCGEPAAGLSVAAGGRLFHLFRHAARDRRRQPDSGDPAEQRHHLPRQRLGTGRRERQVAPASRRTRDAFDQLHEPDLAADCGSSRDRAA